MKFSFIATSKLALLAIVTTAPTSLALDLHGDTLPVVSFANMYGNGQLTAEDDAVKGSKNAEQAYWVVHPCFAESGVCGDGECVSLESYDQRGKFIYPYFYPDQAAEPTLKLGGGQPESEVENNLASFCMTGANFGPGPERAKKFESAMAPSKYIAITQSEGPAQLYDATESREAASWTTFIMTVQQIEVHAPKPVPTPSPSGYGDPHFITWGGQKCDFHGGCDLVLLQNSGFADGLGLDIHIQTIIKGSWSYIGSAAVQIGGHSLEITGGSESGYWINGGEKKELGEGDGIVGEFPVHFRRVNDHQTRARIDLDLGGAISMETFKDFVRVNFKDTSKTAFQGSVGLLGAYNEHGSKVGRDGKTVFENTDDFGQEWMVHPGDALIFHDRDAAQFPLVCPMPDKTLARRRLAESAISEEEAYLACSHVRGVHRDACMFDVLMTQDKDIGGSYV